MTVAAAAVVADESPIIPMKVKGQSHSLFNDNMIVPNHRNYFLWMVDNNNKNHFHDSIETSTQQASSSSSSSSSSLSVQQQLRTATTTTTQSSHDNRRPRRPKRNLFLFSTAATGNICSLTVEQFDFIQNPITLLYVWDGQIKTTTRNTNNNYNNYNNYNLGFNSNSNNNNPLQNATALQEWWDVNTVSSQQPTNSSNNSTNLTRVVVTVRACLCTQYIDDRPIEFCSAEYASCSIRTTPVQCFTLSSTNTFIQSFWPVIVFWMLVVVYVWSCSDPGRIARQYYFRKFRCCCSLCSCGSYCHHQRCYLNRQQQQQQQQNPQTPETASNQPIEDGQQQQPIRNDTDAALLTEQEIVQQQLDHIIENYPSRANYMYREAINRQNRLERYERQRQTYQWYRTYQHIKEYIIRCICFSTSTTTTTAPVNNNDTTGMIVDVGDDLDDVPPPRSTTTTSPPQETALSLRPRLLLKTKIFRHDDIIPVTTNKDPLQQEHLTHPQQQQQQKQQQCSESYAIADGTPAATNVMIESNTYDDDDYYDIHNTGISDTMHCAICLLPLQDGIDTIGDLPCRHCMHKDCLKEWLLRKNRCPLCQLSDVALYQNSSTNHNHNSTNQQPQQQQHVTRQL